MSDHEHLGEGGRRLPRPTSARQEARQRSPWLLFGGLAAFALLLLAIDHRAHVLGWLPWLILLACPLMHLFMHGPHGHGHHRGSSAGSRERSPSDAISAEQGKDHD